MVAIALPTPAPRTRPVGPRPAPSADRPRLEAVAAGPAAHPLARSRWWVLAAVVAVAASLGLALSSPVDGSSPATAGVHVVESGETMWSIAVEHAPAGEAATYVERLVAANGGAAVASGQRIVLPAA